ncbi:MAG: hypothetical protein PHQ67_10870 [Fermentimonas sp.]|nr:hypothetical protein [Fermentimonas sp.]
MKTKVLQAMKPKVASLGFTKEEIESVVDSISETLQEDATEEQINAQIDAVIPYLKLSQSAVTRIVNAKKKEEKPPKAPDVSKTTETEKGAESKQEEEEAPSWAKAMMKEIADLKGEKVIKSRQDRFDELIKDLPEKQKQFVKLTFKPASYQDDESFEEDIQKIKEIIPEIQQEISNEGLGGMGKPRIGGKSLDKQASDQEIKDVINQLNI